MKKLITAIAILISVKSYSQDSTIITISPQTRDIEYLAQYIVHNTEMENIFDSVKIKFRIPVPPTGNTTVSISGYTMDFYRLFVVLKNDATAIKANCTSRIEALLRALNQPYLTSKLDALDVADAQTFQTMRQFGRDRLRRKTN